LTWLVAVLVVALVYLAFVWSLARMAARSDKRMREIFKDKE